MLIHIPMLDALLEPYAAALGKDAAGYRNHAYRVVNLGWSLGGGDDAAFQRLVIAAAFHDLGIWSANTFDYIGPSRELARRHLSHIERDVWGEDIDQMIDNHHRVRRFATDSTNAVERFRRADWADLGCGLFDGGFDQAVLACVRKAFPSRGFHCGLVRRTLRRAITHPFDPLPMLRW